MKRVLNEQGGALLIVFFILILFMILGVSLSSFIVHGGKQRAFADDEIQGKMLADTGLAYFKQYLEKKMNDEDSPIKSSGQKDSTAVDTFILDKVNEVASEITLENEKGPYKKYTLPGVNQGGFALGYKKEKIEENGIIPYVNDPKEPSQPYVRKITLYVLGLPARTINETEKARRVLLTSTVYINTVPAPFHYAVSTPGELRLFGGTNIIGNVAAGSILVSTDYRYLDNNTWKTGNRDDSNELDGLREPLRNQPYIEGTVFLSEEGTVSKLANVKNVEPSASDTFPDKTTISLLNRTSLKSQGIFTPKVLPTDSSKTELSAPKEKPYIPGYEPPLIERKTKEEKEEKADDISLFVKERIGDPDSPVYVGAATAGFEAASEPLSFEQGEEDGFKNVASKVNSLSSDILVIRSQTKDPLSNNAPIPLTVRLTGDILKNKVKQLYIGPSEQTNPNHYPNVKTTVEMGHLGAFKDGADGKPFAFEGTIYIKGNLDIVGDINIKGTIYVDGDVVIREIENVGNENLAIVASGKISLTARNTKQSTDSTEDYLTKWAGNADDGFRPLSAFLYSEQSLEIYSVNSFNRIYGGIATGREESYLEFNTKRERTARIHESDDPNSNYLASRFTIQFNRKIFEKEMYGLPPGDTFFLDIYDIEYHQPSQVPQTVEFAS